MALALLSRCHQGKPLWPSPFKRSNHHQLDSDPNIQNNRKTERDGGGAQEASVQAEAEWPRLGTRNHGGGLGGRA